MSDRKKAKDHGSRTKKAKRRKRTKKYRWDLYRDGITQSGLRLFLQCRHQFYLTYAEGWTKREFYSPIFFGSAVHDILASIHSGMSLSRALATFEYNIDEDEKRRTDSEVIDHWLMLVQEISAAYKVFWEADESKEWIVRENTFQVEYKVPGAEQPIPLRGRWDGGFREKGAGNLLLETKTKGQINEEILRHSLPFDIQTLFYSIAAEEADIFSGPVNGVLYDVIRRPGQRRKKDEPLEEFLSRVRKDIVDRPAWYFMRWLHTFKPDTLALWRKSFFNKALRQLVDWDRSVKLYGIEESPLHFINPVALSTGWGPAPLFNMVTMDTKFGYVKRSVPFPELED